MNPRTLIAFLVLLQASPASASPPVIDDIALINEFTRDLGELADGGNIPTADDLKKIAAKAPRFESPLELPPAEDAVTSTSYDALSQSVYLVGTVYNCGKCNQWHRSGSATAWCLGSDGLMVTNAHVFLNAQGAAMGVSDRDGRCFPVTEVLAIDSAADIAVFRVRAEGLQALPVGPTAEVGDDITIISHPSGNYFMRTSGSVARYLRRPSSKNAGQKVVWMSVTADYAKGSSGGPVFNSKGQVVGMVATTNSIYTGPKTTKKSKNAKAAPTNPKGDLQMVMKHCVPIDSIRNLFRNQTVATPDDLELEAGL
ncbi:MAG: S1 family peptidase [Verrucomicrobiales bacterium]|nr:serine protease [Verrucomicrobiota bacterium JB025]